MINRKLNPEEENKLSNYLTQTLKETSDGSFRFIDKKPALQALMWWDKELH